MTSETAAETPAPPPTGKGGRPRVQPWPFCSRDGCEVEYRATLKQRAITDAGRPSYCSRACQQAATYVTLPCAGCGADVKRTQRQRSRATTETVVCSKACMGKVGTKPRTGRNLPCGACGVDVWTITAHDDGRARYCSKDCTDEAQRAGRVSRICEQCGESEMVPASRAGRFCSKRCEGAHSTANAKGWINKDGYRMLSQGGSKGARGEHLVFAERVLGRPLHSCVNKRGNLVALEEVHHRNGNRSDNRTDGPFVMDGAGRLVSGNFEIWSKSQPAGQEVGPKLDWALDLLDLYAAQSPLHAARLAEIAGRLASATLPL